MGGPLLLQNIAQANLITYLCLCMLQFSFNEWTTWINISRGLSSMHHKHYCVKGNYLIACIQIFPVFCWEKGLKFGCNYLLNMDPDSFSTAYLRDAGKIPVNINALAVFSMSCVWQIRMDWNSLVKIELSELIEELGCSVTLSKCKEWKII